MRDRQELEQAINEGGSVLVNGEIISRLEDLPTDDVLFAADPTRLQEIKAARKAKTAADAETGAVAAGLGSEQPAPSVPAEEPAPGTVAVPLPTVPTPPPPPASGKKLEG